ncbi:MAG: polysaccharide deacetylase family protein [Planctomycetota bacterium]
MVEEERRLGVTSTFYFLNETLPFKLFYPGNWRLSVGRYSILDKRVQESIKHLDENGWEVGVHGSFDSYKDENLLSEEKKALEQILGHPVSGIRQHFLNLDGQTWKLQKAAGFKYDASYGFTDDVGFKEKKYHAFYPGQLEGYLIVPLAVMDFCLMAKPDPWKVTTDLIAEAEENEACLVINWHQRTFNEKEFPGYGDLYFRIIRECQDRKATFLNVDQYVERIRNNHI